MTQFQWSGDVLIGEVDGRGIEASRRYRYGTDWSPLEYTSDDAAFQVASNHIMTPTALVDRAGSMAWSDTRGPFGESTETGADSPNSVDFRIGFPGQYHDAESKLSYNNQRYYDPKIGRYLRNDPIGMAGGMNQYRYAMNNPVGAIDPRGEIAFVPAFFIAAEIAGVAYSGYELYQAFRNPCSTALDYVLPVLGLVGVGGVGAIASVRYLNSTRGAAANAQLLGVGDQLTQAAKWIKPQQGTFDVVAHGSANAFHVLHNGKWVELSHRSMATFITSNGHSGQSVRLISCSTGACANGVAQNLANKLGVHLSAPSNTVWLHPNGRLTIGIDSATNTGVWNNFTPGR